MSISRSLESSYLNDRYKYLIGSDEAGRGPLAGPVVAAACYVPPEVEITGIYDSKATNEEDREEVYNLITSNPNIAWSVHQISNEEIDEINILQASLKAMRESIHSVLEKSSNRLGADPRQFIAFVDGNKIPNDMKIDTKCVIRGDSLIYSIAAASILAKVTRDRIMIDLSRQYPKYQFDKHKGYPTEMHRRILMEIGPSPVHRFTYAPVKASAEKFAIRSSQLLTATNEVDTQSHERSISKKRKNQTKVEQDKEDIADKGDKNDVNKKSGIQQESPPLRRSQRLRTVSRSESS